MLPRVLPALLFTGVCLSLAIGLPAVAGAALPQDGGGDAPPGDDAVAAPVVTALAIDDPVVVDGYLEDAAWGRAAPATGFIQREPEQGAPASERTEVYVLYTETTLYIGVRALDAEPSAIVASEMRRDGSGGGFRGGALDADDNVSLVLDTFGDRRNAFFFETNPNGARSDALITDEGRDRNFEWDGVWDAAARITAEGWSAELAIPFSTLRFDQDLDTWGFNVRRRIRRKSEEAFWAPIDRDADIFRISRAGQLTGLQLAGGGLNLRLKPFVVGSGSEGFDSEPGTIVGDAQGGLDARWGLTQGLTLDLTYNTDFAQVEVDEQQVNLTRFSLFFPEKREFFLENAGIFEFGTGGGGRRAPLLKAFFSRRIGIGEGGVEVPILAGARLTGRVGDWNLGVLDVQTESVRDEAGTLLEPSTNWGVVRVKRNVGARSSIGAIFTNRQAEGTGDWNRVWGLDADLNPHRNLSIDGFVTGSDDPGDGSSGGGRWAASGGIGWRGPVWRWGFDVLEVQENYNPELGFLLREGIRRFNQDVDFEPRPDLPGIRSLSFNARAEVVTTGDGTLETVDSSIRYFGFRTDSEDFVSFTVGPAFERLFEPFEIREGIFIPPGEYTFHDWSVFFNTSSGRPVSVDGNVSWGQFFDGTRGAQRLGVELRPSGNLGTETEWNRNDVELPGGDFVTNIWRQRVNVSFSPEIFLNTFVQYSDSSELVSLNTRFNWIYRPGADLFVVYNQSWETPDDGPATTRDRALIVKFTYLVSF